VHAVGEPNALHDLLREMSSWWRRLASSTTLQTSGCWNMRGPAATDARVGIARLLQGNREVRTCGRMPGGRD
jgi:hypothetical protein